MPDGPGPDVITDQLPGARQAVIQAVNDQFEAVPNVQFAEDRIKSLRDNGLTDHKVSS